MLGGIGTHIFFTRHHYGEGPFECDESGRVARLIITEASREFVFTSYRSVA